MWIIKKLLWLLSDQYFWINRKIFGKSIGDRYVILIFYVIKLLQMIIIAYNILIKLLNILGEIGDSA
jgi:hypothetical protein